MDVKSQRIIVQTRAWRCCAVHYGTACGAQRRAEEVFVTLPIVSAESASEADACSGDLGWMVKISIHQIRVPLPTRTVLDLSLGAGMAKASSSS